MGRGAHDAGAVGSRSSSCRRRRPRYMWCGIRKPSGARATSICAGSAYVHGACPCSCFDGYGQAIKKVDSTELSAATATAVPSDHQERSKRKELNQRVATAIKPHPFLGGVNWRCSGGSAIIHTHGPMASRTPISSCTLFPFVTSRRTATARRHLTPGAPPPQQTSAPTNSSPHHSTPRARAPPPPPIEPEPPHPTPRRMQGRLSVSPPGR